MSTPQGVTPAKPVPMTSPPPVAVSEEAPTQRITLLSELDSYIAERMKEQPKTLEDVETRAQSVDTRPRNRMQLPNYFEKFSGDHGKRAGAYIFRWVYKDKRSVDLHLAKGWTFVNRTYFPAMPRYLLSANGGVEIGDTILAFLPVKQALALRDAPAKLSQERIRGQMTQTSPDYILMTGNQKADNVYQPELGPETAETTEERVPGVLTEGRDF